MPHRSKGGDAQRRESECRSDDEATVAAALARVGRELIAARETPALLATVGRLTAELLGCSRSHTLLWRAEENVFVPASGHGYAADDWEAIAALQVPASMMAGLPQRLEHDAVVFLDPSSASSRPLAALAKRYDIVRAFAVALWCGEQIAGIHIGCYGTQRPPFTDVELRIAEGIAQLASLALPNARLVEELEQTNRFKSDLMATLSHELRTPLTAIMCNEDLLCNGMCGPLTADQADVVRRIGGSAREVLSLVNATLDVSRLQCGRATLQVSAVNVSELLAEVETETRQLRERASLHFWQSTERELPLLQTDRTKLKVVLKNLIINAMKYTDKGSVIVGARVRDNGIEFAVTDTGIGIAPEALLVIFDPFRQVDEGGERGGVGLGLYIVRRLLDMLSGTIRVESEVQRGSTFWVWVPLRPREDARAATHDSTRLA